MRAAASRRVIRYPPSGQGSAQAVAALAFTARVAVTFGSEREAKDWAQRNKVDLRDLHIRNVGGQRVEVGIRKSAYDTRENYDNQHGQRRDGVWR